MLLITSFMSCDKKELFDKELYRYYIKSNYPVDTLEIDHPWTLIQRYHVAVTANVKDDNIRELRLYSGHPTLGDGSQSLAQANITTGETVTVSYDIAQTATGTLYAALVTREGTTYVTPFAIGQESVNFSSGQITTLSIMPVTDWQTFTYLFESSFPTPDDFDYNDIVMRIARYAPRNNNLQIRVTLSAVGSFKQVAGAIRLPGIDYDKVESVTIIEGKPFDDKYPYNYRKISMSDNLARGRSGEAVIRLFEDAHWSLKSEVDELGAVTYKPINTELFADEDTVTTMPEQTRTYNILLKDGVNADSIRLDDLDPFIIQNNANINFEVHTYKYKFEEVIWEYLGADKQAYDDYLAWALVIPDNKFLYPVEQVPIGTYRNGELYGAYGQYMHSFGQWARNYRVARDWWQYPNKALVYSKDSQETD